MQIIFAHLAHNAHRKIAKSKHWIQRYWSNTKKWSK